ncbi:CheR family methyltransferase [Altererythrobacter sp. GH1-8]|uniref:CheR family methyltransferase n=1 Tax=Altererythrobacter sp. GH1-8 TaxID=3349333 RepID=UPI00374DE517
MTLVLKSGEERAGGIIPGVSPQVYSADDFAHIAALAHREAGIVLDDSKRMLVYSRIAPLVRKSGCTSFAELRALLHNDARLAATVLAALTTNHTYFHRESHHFDYLADHLRDELIARLNSGDAIRIWSAGCSSGEEIWNIMMVLLGPDRREGRTLANANLLALATDLAPHALAKAEAGSYPAESLKDLDPALVANWCEQDGQDLRIGPEARKCVRFRQLNLLHEWPMSGQFDIIFCRNVMIYFDQPTKDRLVRRFAERLKPGGYLFIGHSERINSDAVAMLDTLGPTIYRRKER